MKTKLQPQRKKQPAQPGFDGSSDINKYEIPDNEIEASLSSGVDVGMLDFEAPTSLSDINLLDDVFLEPLLSIAEPTIEHHLEENEKDGKAKKVQVNDASDCCMEETIANGKQGQNSESMREKEKEDAPDLDDIFDFLDDTDPILEMDEADHDPTDKDFTGEEEIEEREGKELKNDDQRPSKRNRDSTNAEEQAEEESPKKKGKLSHRIRRKRRKVDPTLAETPENEINPKQISIRNLILLAEAKEKKWNKEAASRNSSGDGSSMPRRREPEEFEFFYFDGHEEENSRRDSGPQDTFEATTKKLNYHTYMNRSSSSRWTQLETELFYKGIHQFARIHDAITHRLPDNSQFEKVIEILEIQPDEVLPEESEPSSKAAHWKNEEEMDEEVENSQTSFSDLNDTGKHESVPNDDLDAVFVWDNQEMEQ
ncbi:Transcription factor TFIIIB component B [Rhynchospora pubera]|uniref:Transcription factor TFIIIB component B n=1 Tax=Rhynchospora pubera TaxID=906938 RepID=A0AAV8EKU8_9POAL|nr:Transcription factor TFIIIB component B [Rhynchospora pubera]